MKKIYLLLLAIGGFTSSFAGYNPLALTGFNEDVISNGSGAALTSISANLPNGFDNAGYALVSQDYSYNGNVPTYFLPTGGLVASTLTSGLNYQFANYSSNNALYLINTNDSGVLSLTTPQSEGALYILGTTGSAGPGPATCTAIVNFSDGTSQTFTGLAYPDWYQGTAATPGIGRVNTNDNIPEGDASNPHMVEIRIDLAPGNLTKIINSVTIKKTSSNGRLGIFAITGVSVCTGTPTPGTISATLTSGCGSYNPALSLSGQTTDGGITYQWQSSATGSAPWTNVAGATTTSYTPNVTSTIYYQVVVTCSASSLSATATPVELTNSGVAPTYATVPYFQGFESWTAGCYTFDLPDAHWTQNPPTSDNSWRREDQGTDANWFSPTNGAYSPSSNEGSHSADFHSSEDGGSNGDLDLYINLSSAGTKSINFDYINTSASSSDLTVELSEDGGISFTTLGTYGSNGGWTPEQLITNSVATNAVIRFQGYGDYSSSDIGLDSVSVYALPACTGTPTAGSFTASQTTGCTPYSSTLTLTTPTLLSNIVYQWQSSTDGVNWTNVAGATNLTYTASVTTSVYYRIYVECTNSSQADTTAATELVFSGVTFQHAALPYFEGFETWTGICFTYDRPENDTNWNNTPASGNNSWRRDDQGDDAFWDNSTGGAYNPTSTEGAHSARFHSDENSSGAGDLDLYVDLSAAGTKAINFDYINSSTSGNDATLNVELSEDNGATFTSIGSYTTTNGWQPYVLITNSVSSIAVIRFEGNGEFAGNDIGIDSVYVYVLPPCSGQPTAGIVNQTHPNSSCASFIDTFTVATPTYQSNINYQWQTSADGVNWTNVGTNSTMYVQSITTASNYFRFYITCTNSNQSDTSNVVMAAVIVPVAGTATIPYFQGFENWIGTCFTYDRPDTNWLTSPSYGENSWRRDDQGSDAGWNYTPGGAYTPTSSEAAHSARFHTYGSSNGATGTMDLHVDLSPAGPKAIQFDFINIQTGSTSNDDYLTVELSEDNGTTWSTLGNYTNANTWTPEYLFTNSVAANAIIRFIATSDQGPTDIGLDSLNIEMATACSGTPTAGAVNVSQYTGCSSFSSMLSLNVDPTVADLTYEWQSSPDNINWTTVSPADTTSQYTATVNSGIMYYRAYVTCTISNNTDTSSSVELQVVTPVAAYAALPYFQGFENWEGTCFLYDRPDTNWLNTPSSGNNSWRRDDQGTDANWSDPTNGVYSPSSSELNHSARFHANANFNDPGDLDLYVNLSTVGTKALQFDYFNQSGTSGDVTLTVELSEDGGSTFTTIGTYANSNTNWTPVELYINSVATQGVIRFEGNGEFAPYDLGLDSVNIYVLPPCSGIPNITTISQTNALGCTAYTDTLSPGSPITVSGLTYQWQSSPDNTTWTSIAGATNMTDAQYVSTATEYFRLIVTCTNSNLSDTTASSMAGVTHLTGVATLPYFQGFENWIGACYTYDLPDSNWNNNPNYGNDSWRRDDQGSDAGWIGTNNGAYTPASSEGDHSARFHVDEAPNGTSGNLDLNVNLSMSGTKDIYFDVLNNSSSGDPYITVELSLDSGTTFTVLSTYYPASGSAWQPELLTTTAVSPHAVLRFSGSSDFSDNDMGIDSLYITGPACDTVLNLAVNNISATGANISWTAISGVAGYVYALDQNTAASGTGTFTTTSTYGASGLTPGTTYYFHILTNCSAGDSSAWETISFTTLDTCSPPSNITVVSLPPDGAILSWTGVAGSTGYAYVIDQSSGVPTGTEVASSATIDTVYGLDYTVAYCYHVRNYCSNGDSSAWVTFCSSPLNVVNASVGDFAIQASPNPASNKVSITVNGTQYGKSYLRLTDLTGKVIQTVLLDGNRTTLDISTLASGVYFINYVDDVHNQVLKLVKDQ